jgi:hypothetical protein
METLQADKKAKGIVICRRVRPTNEEIDEANAKTDKMTDAQIEKGIRKNLKGVFSAIMEAEYAQVLARHNRAVAA